ncbi:MAG: peptidylprolyl isomerase [Clostridia bacterium]|nr:peptidylprolyl isomerase [Clostridia bacterium]
MAKQEKTAAELYREERKARIAKAAKKNAKKSHKVVLNKGSKIAIAVVLVIALVAGVGVFALNNSGVLERGKTAFYVGDIEVKAPEYGYYYNSIFSNFFNYSYQYDTYYGAGMGKMYTGYDYATSPDVQAYDGEVEGVENPMYTDYFEQSAKDSIKYVKASVLYAQENGITLDEEDLASVDETIEELKSTAKENNYSVPAYLRAFYGKGMTVDLLRQICEEQTLATKVQTVKTEEFAAAYTDEEIEKIYNDDLTAYGVVSLRLYEVVADTVEVPAEEEGGEATEEVTKETMAAAKTKAESFASKVKDSDSFKATAAEFEKLAENDSWEELKTDDSKTLLEDYSYASVQSESSDEDFIEWAFDKNTAAGETYIVENEDTGYSVYMMVAPVHKVADEWTYDVRHILIKFPEEEESADDAEENDAAEEEKEEVEVELLDASKYDVTVDIDVDLENTGDKALYKEAQTILEDYLAGDKTEDAFAELAKTHSADGNAAEGGIYEDVTMGYMVSEFEDWAMAEGREYGDVGIVETQYGYHIMYFIGTDVTTWSDVIRNDKGAHDYEDFSAEIEDGDNVKIDGIVEDAIIGTEEFIVKLAKQQIRSIQQSASATY